MAFPTDTDLNRSGIYSTERGGQISSITLGENDRVKFVKGAEQDWITIGITVKNAFGKIGQVVVGENVTLNLGTTNANFEWAVDKDSAVVPTNVVGETGSHVVVTYSNSQSKTYDWDGSKWVEHVDEPGA